ncbi:hypothetical protein ACTJJ0_11145 [Chitinophaga sp. 22321]|uniref:hypothetical protein n=1 Tax=Chitinophaga sp. 22321 TaxID=3453909 RepID=UPI003F86DE70
MKTVIFLYIIAFSLFYPSVSKAQLLEEWINQKSTQKKYLAVQIAALQTYIGYLKKGYNVVNGGLTTIGKIKNGDLNLHSEFFSSLKKVNPRIKGNVQTLQLIADQIEIIKYCKRSYQQIAAINSLSTENLSIVQNTYSGFIAGISDDTDMLTTVLTDGNFEMSDDQRMQKIAQLFDQLIHRKEAIQSYTTEIISHAQQSRHALNDLLITRKLHLP